jgi:aspartate carbamoyltransferase catalytic subunit
MRSFEGRDILSLKGFERGEFEHVFAVADELEQIARRRRNVDLLAENERILAGVGWRSLRGCLTVASVDTWVQPVT